MSIIPFFQGQYIYIYIYYTGAEYFRGGPGPCLPPLLPPLCVYMYVWMHACMYVLFTIENGNGEGDNRLGRACVGLGSGKHVRGMRMGELRTLASFFLFLFFLKIHVIFYEIFFFEEKQKIIRFFNRVIADN